MARTGAIKGTSAEKIYQELGLESLKPRIWFRKLFCFYKIFNETSSSYLFNLIPNFNMFHNARLTYNIPPIKVRHNYFKNSFFSSAITEWNRLDLNIRSSVSLNTFKNLLNFIQPFGNSIFDIHNPLGIKLLTRLRLGLNHLHEHKFTHSFQYTLKWYTYANEAKILNQQCISFSTAPTSSFIGKPSFRTLGTWWQHFISKQNPNNSNSYGHIAVWLSKLSL